jgi:hypothetical protein
MLVHPFGLVHMQLQRMCGQHVPSVFQGVTREMRRLFRYQHVPIRKLSARLLLHGVQRYYSGVAIEY